jgi:hypothetical protein
MAGGGFSTTSLLQNQRETYTVTLVRGNRRTGTSAQVTNNAGAGSVFDKPLDNIGAKTFPGNSYANYAAAHIYTVNIPGCTGQARLFVGQRAESFAVNLGTIFDLVNAPASVITNSTLRGAIGTNPIGNKNVTTLALEVPASCLRNASADTVIGAWTTASLRQVRVLNPTARYTLPAKEGGAWVQVSRLGMPLVNELFIGVVDKDRFNSSEPRDDLGAFAAYFLRPTLAQLLQILFGVIPPRADRQDLVTAFLTGVAGVNQFPNGVAPTPGGSILPAEILRLNTNTTGVLAPRGAATQNNLGLLGCFTRSLNMPAALIPTLSSCDMTGFPNGRRPGDDVVDSALRLAMGVLLSDNAAPNGGTPFHDAVLQDATQFDSVFPYLKTPNPGS